MSQQNNDTAENTPQRKKLSGRQIKWIIIILIILAVAAGFLHQYYLRTDSRVVKIFENNQTQFEEAASFFLTNDPAKSAEQAVDKGGYTTPDKNKVSVGLLISDENNADVKAQLEQLESKADLDSISASGTVVTFYTLYGCRYIYSDSGKSPSESAKKLNENWYYVVSAS